MDIPLTFQCNNNCVSCIIDSRLSMMRGRLNWSEISKRIDRIPDSCDTVGITGGEPTLSPYFFRALMRIKKRRPDIMVFLVTNGRLFSYKNFAKKLASLGISSLRVGIALYSHSHRVHDRITSSRGSWKQTTDGIKNLISLGISVELRIIVNSMNYIQMPEIAEHIRSELKGVERVVFINMKYTGNAFLNRDKIFVKYSKAVPFVVKATELLEDSGVEVKLFHFPLCILPEAHRQKARGVTKQKSELAFSDNCVGCGRRDECPMIWKSYLVLAGGDEFCAI